MSLENKIQEFIDKRGDIVEEYKIITISVDEYEQLKTDRDKLAALEAVGVDNWEGYDDAMQLFFSGTK